MRILVSVSNPIGLSEFLTELSQSLNPEVVATSETAEHLKKASIPHTTVEQVTGYAEMLDGRTAVFHPRIVGGIIADHDNVLHRNPLKRQNIHPFDLVIVNLAAHPNVDHLDIGRFSLLIAATHQNKWPVAVIVDQSGYSEVIKDILAEGEISLMTRLLLASKALYIASDWLIPASRRARHNLEALQKLRMQVKKVEAVTAAGPLPV